MTCIINVAQFIVPTKIIPTTRAAPTKPNDDNDHPDGMITTDKPYGIITTNEPYSIFTTDRTVITTKESPTAVLGNSIERNLAVIVGASLAGVILLLVAMIVLILIIAVVLYKAKHNKSTITQSRSVYQQ